MSGSDVRPLMSDLCPLSSVFCPQALPDPRLQGKFRGAAAVKEGMKHTPTDGWRRASQPSAAGQWVEARLPDGRLAVAKQTDFGWQPLYPAGSPVAWRPLGDNRFRAFPRPSVA